MQWAFLALLDVSGEPRRKLEESLLVGEEKGRRRGRGRGEDCQCRDMMPKVWK